LALDLEEVYQITSIPAKTALGTPAVYILTGVDPEHPTTTLTAIVTAISQVAI